MMHRNEDPPRPALEPELEPDELDDPDDEDELDDDDFYPDDGEDEDE